MNGDLIASLIFWPVVLLLALWHVRRKKAPHISTSRAYLTFLGILGGGGLVLLFIAVTLVISLDPESKNTAVKALAPILVIGGLLPLWRLAHRKISG